MYIGNAATFDFVEFTLSTVSTGLGILPTFQFWNGAVWTSFSPNDGTDGFLGSGTIQWVTAGLTGWSTTSVGSSTQYYIRITRTNASTIMAPIETQIQTSTTSSNGWDSSANITCGNLTLSGQVATTGQMVRSASYCTGGSGGIPNASLTLYTQYGSVTNIGSNITGPHSYNGIFTVNQTGLYLVTFAFSVGGNSGGTLRQVYL